MQLRQRLSWFAKMVQTLQDASALLGLKGNLNVKEGGTLGNLADQLIGLGEDPERPLAELALQSENFHRVLEPYADALAAAEQLGSPAAVELLKFLRDEVVDNDLRDLVDSGAEEQAGLGEAVMALLKVHTVLKPLLPPRYELHGTPQGALEVLQQQMRGSQMAGGELSSLLEQCVAHLHALRRTYKSITEKGEQSKETITAVVERGTFVFGAATGLKVELSGEVGAGLDEPVLRELRSRALLEINAKRGGVSAEGERQKLETFLDLTQTAASVAESIAELQELGYFKPEAFEQQICAQQVDQLRKFDVALRDLRTSWRSAISSAREQTFELSFFCSQQLYQLHQQLRDASMADGPTLLQYVPATPHGEDATMDVDTPRRDAQSRASKDAGK